MSLRLIPVMLCLAMCTSIYGSEHQFKYFKLDPSMQNQTDFPAMVDKLWNKIKKDGYKAVNSALRKILDTNSRIKLGQYNFPELAWSANLDANIQLAAIRRLEPMLNGSAWRVLDRIILGVGAKTFLKNLRDAGKIQITDAQLKLFTGVVFKREYSYEHIAASYREGLISDFDKLLLSFKKFENFNFFNLEEGEILRKDDYMSAEVGMSVETPSIYWMSAGAVGTIYFTKLANITYQMGRDVRSQDPVVKTSSQKIQVKGSRLQLELQLDFLNLLKITLLGGEYTGSMTKSRLSTYQFDEEQMDIARNDEAIEQALIDFNKGKDPESLSALASFRLSSEDSIAISEGLSAFAFMWGKYWGNMTEGIIFNQWGSNRYFYRHQQERVAFDRKILDFIFRSDDLSKFKSREVENILFEYESSMDESDFDTTILNERDNMSFRMSKEYIAKENRSSDRKRVKNLIHTFQTIDGGIVQGVDDGDITAPFYLDLHAQVSKRGMLDIFRRGQAELHRLYGFICAGQWLRPGQKISRQIRHCINKLGQKFEELKEIYLLERKIPLKAYKTFLSFISQRTESFLILKHLFGEHNVQLYGTFRGQTREQQSFQTFVKEGDFQGYGVIKDSLESL